MGETVMGKKADRTEFEERVYAVCARIPRGKVSTYADVAAAVGRRGMARAAGNALGRNPYDHVPCYRVVRSDGDVGGYSGAGGSRSKARKLRADGLEIAGTRIVDLDRHLVDGATLRGGSGAVRKKGGDPEGTGRRKVWRKGGKT
jgi:methylated-DNA-[protein]-cysteine S-methyltransferase